MFDKKLFLSLTNNYLLKSAKITFIVYRIFGKRKISIKKFKSYCLNCILKELKGNGSFDIEYCVKRTVPLTVYFRLKNALSPGYSAAVSNSSSILRS